MSIHQEEAEAEAEELALLVIGEKLERITRCSGRTEGLKENDGHGCG